MTIPNFYQWIETSNLDKQTASPASAEVIRTGLQPQVGAETEKKEDQDEILALDSHIQRLKEVVKRMQSKSDKTEKIKQLMDQFMQAWEEVTSGNAGIAGEDDGLGDARPSEDELDQMKNNQPLPEPSRSFDSIPGGQPPIS